MTSLKKVELTEAFIIRFSCFSTQNERIEKIYTFPSTFFFDLSLFKSFRHKTIPLRPEKGHKVYISVVYHPFLMFEYSKYLSGKFEMGLLNKLF